MRRQPAVDLVVGPQAYHQLPELLTRTARARGELARFGAAPGGVPVSLAAAAEGGAGVGRGLSVPERMNLDRGDGGTYIPD